MESERTRNILLANSIIKSKGHPRNLKRILITDEFQSQNGIFSVITCRDSRSEICNKYNCNYLETVE